MSIAESASHRWMQGTERRLEQLMTHRRLWSISDSYRACKAVLPHVETKELNGLGS